MRRVTTAATRATTGVASRRANLVTLTLIGINLAVYALELAAGGTINGLDNWIYEHGVLIANGVYQNGHIFPVPVDQAIPPGYEAAGVKNGEWWRLLTSAFLHYGPFHLLMNMYSLYFAGSILEQVIGRWRFLLLYLVSGIAGAAGALFWSPNAATVGASGAIFGVLGALFVLERRGHLATGGQIAALIVINLVFTFALSSFISVGGHVGGLVGGLVLTLAFVRFRASTPLTIASAVVVAAASVLLAYSAI